MDTRMAREARALYEAILASGKARIAPDQYAFIRISREDCDPAEYHETSVVATFNTTGCTYFVLRPLDDGEFRKFHGDHQKTAIDVFKTYRAVAEVVNVGTLAELVLYFHITILDSLADEEVDEVGFFSRAGGNSCAGSSVAVRRGEMSMFGPTLERFLSG